MYLMLADKEVLYFDFDEYIVHEINKGLVPFCLRGAFKSGSDVKSLSYNIRLLKQYLSSRALSPLRDNVRQICSLFDINLYDSVEICLRSHGVAVTDSYWVKGDTEDLKYSDVNIRYKDFTEIVDTALYGQEVMCTVSPLNPELTTHGTFRKAWIHEDDGLYLLKSDRHLNNINTRMEVLSSDILDCFSGGIEYVKYVGMGSGGLYIDKCNCFIDDACSFVEAWEVMEFCKREGINFRDMLGYSPEASSIGVLDFILVNTDRHTQNYGFFMDNKIGEIVGLIPLFDFNLALVADAFGRNAEDTLNQMFENSFTLRQVAEMYKPYSKLCLDRYRFMDLYKKYKDYGFILDKVLQRCEYMEV